MITVSHYTFQQCSKPYCTKLRKYITIPIMLTGLCSEALYQLLLEPSGLGDTRKTAVTRKCSITAAAAEDQLVSCDLTKAGSWEANVKHSLLSISLKDSPASDLFG